MRYLSLRAQYCLSKHLPTGTPEQVKGMTMALGVELRVKWGPSPLPQVHRDKPSSTMQASPAFFQVWGAVSSLQITHLPQFLPRGQIYSPQWTGVSSCNPVAWRTEVLMTARTQLVVTEYQA